MIGRKTVLAAAFSMVTMPVWADANADANSLFVESMKAWSEAQQISGSRVEQYKKRLELLRKIQANLTRIVDRHPSSDLAVQLMLRPVGPLSFDELSSLIAEQQIDLAKSQLLSGNVRDAQLLLGQVVFFFAQKSSTSNNRLGFLLEDLSYSQAVIGDWSEALATAKKIHDAYSRASALSHIAIFVAKSGNPFGARMLIDAALKDILELEESSQFLFLDSGCRGSGCSWRGFGCAFDGIAS